MSPETIKLLQDSLAASLVGPGWRIGFAIYGVCALAGAAKDVLAYLRRQRPQNAPQSDNTGPDVGRDAYLEPRTLLPLRTPAHDSTTIVLARARYLERAGAAVRLRAPSQTSENDRLDAIINDALRVRDIDPNEHFNSSQNRPRSTLQ